MHSSSLDHVVLVAGFAIMRIVIIISLDVLLICLKDGMSSAQCSMRYVLSALLVSLRKCVVAVAMNTHTMSMQYMRRSSDVHRCRYTVKKRGDKSGMTSGNIHYSIHTYRS